MKKTLAAGAFVLAGVAGASAADLPTVTVPTTMPTTTPTFSWDGVYFGAYGGVGFVGPGAFIVGQLGAQGGYNFVSGGFLAGLEGQLGVIVGPGPFVVGEANLNARLGALLGSNALIYGEAGLGYIIGFGGIPMWSAGGGVEFAMGTNTSLFVEAKAVGLIPGGFAGITVQAGVNFHR